MDTACDAASLTLPANPSFFPVAQAFAAAAVDRLGGDAQAQEEVKEAIGHILRELVEQAFGPGERQSLTLVSETVPSGFQLSITAKGLPLESRDLPALGRGAAGDASGAPTRLEALLDGVTVVNRGHGGTEIRLVKHLPGAGVQRRVQDCERPASPPRTPRLAPVGRTRFTIRLLTPPDALEVTRTVYKAYGYSYPFEDMYYPERLLAHNTGGRFISAVALAPGGEVAGHAALFKPDEVSRIVEIGLGAVKPEFRGHGCLVQISEFLLAEARRRGFTAIYGRAVTSHTFSQQVIAQFGFQPVALMLGLAPATMEYLGLAEHLPQRETLLVTYRYLEPPEPVTLHPPDRHGEMIFSLYQRLGVTPELGGAGGAAMAAADRRSQVLVKSRALPLGFATLVMQQYGREAAAEIGALLKELQRQRLEVVHLYLDLADPLTGLLTPQFEDLGFFFAGILPGAFGLEALILQYLHNLPLDYELIQMYPAGGRKLLQYIRKNDPNRS